MERLGEGRGTEAKEERQEATSERGEGQEAISEGRGTEGKGR